MPSQLHEALLLPFRDLPTLASEFLREPVTVGPSGVPQIVDVEQARANPELAVLSAMMHGRSSNTDTSVRIALAAQAAIETLDADRSSLYYDIVMNALNESARDALKNMGSSCNYYSDFARKNFYRGWTTVIVKVLGAQHGELTPEVLERLAAASEDQLEEIVLLMIGASTLEDALRPLETAQAPPVSNEGG